jgi:UDPglucose 6-dehydrogenase
MPGRDLAAPCFPKDTTALAAIGQRYGAPVKIVETVIGINDARKRAMADKILAACGGSLNGKTIAVLGLTFKPNTDDMREAPSLVIVPALEAHGARVRAYDPQGMQAARKLMPRVDPYACIEDADAMVILTEWDEFRALDFDRVKAALRCSVVIDLRSIYKPLT